MSLQNQNGHRESAISSRRARIEAICAEFNRTPLPKPVACPLPGADVLDEFRRNVRPLSDHVRAYLGVTDAALKGCADHARERIGGELTPSPIGLASVVFLSDDAFDFAPGAETPDAVDAVVGTAQDANGAPIDIWAWSIRSGIVAALNGRAGVNSIAAAFRARIGDCLSVYGSPLQWLRAGRRGVFLIDLARAAPVLRDAGPLAVDSELLARILRQRLAIAPPTIIVASSSLEVAA